MIQPANVQTWRTDHMTTTIFEQKDTDTGITIYSAVIVCCVKGGGLGVKSDVPSL